MCEGAIRLTRTTPQQCMTTPIRHQVIRRGAAVMTCLLAWRAFSVLVTRW
ncbi:MAG: hypothetical protein GY696_22515 [Gammaproteobacteria bacterium]|nr:hypothetical protein [Gammaproteobacteria bacterium]